MVIEELKTLFAEYETALQSNDIQKLTDFFWDSPQTVRFGQSENLFGSEAIREFRRNRPKQHLSREVVRVEYLVLDDNHGVINMCFIRHYKGVPKEGRQTQVWKRLDGLGWKVVAAHVSLKSEIESKR